MTTPTIGIGYAPELAPFAGRMLDVDSHEQIDETEWTETFGEITRPFAEEFLRNAAGFKDPVTGLYRNVLTETGDSLDWDAAWKTKGSGAFSAGDMAARLELMDYVGVDRQLIFPGRVTLLGVVLYSHADRPSTFPTITGDRRGYARQLISTYNDWAVKQTQISDRLRMVATPIADTPEQLVEQARGYIEAGIRALWIPSSVLPGGRSPAHTDLDPFWDLCAASDTTVTLHVGNEGDFLRSYEWKNAEAFEGWKVGAEFSLDPWTLGTIHMPSENYVTTMVVGGVFERHPRLRLGVIELGSYWIGPLARALDQWALHTNTRSWRERLPLAPSEYISRNVRVAAYHWEAVDQFIEWFQLPDVYCYASDFPHVEGGTDPMGSFANRLARLGSDVMEKFFVTNAGWLMPD